MIGRGLEGRNSVPGRCTIQLKCDGTRWRKGGEVKVKLASTLHTTSEHGVSSITTSDAHTSAASSQLNWRPRRFKWTRPFRRKTKSDFCACAIIFQTQSKSQTDMLPPSDRGTVFYWLVTWFQSCQPQLFTTSQKPVTPIYHYHSYLVLTVLKPTL